jgi:dUTP pyrophosphatase
MKVILVNLGSGPFLIERGERIARLFRAPIQHARFAEAGDLDEIARRHGGYGSTLR